MTSVSYITGDEIVGEMDRNERCVEALERTVQKAKDGEIIGVVVVAQYRDGSNSGFEAGFLYNNRVVGSLMRLVTAISLRD